MKTSVVVSFEIDSEGAERVSQALEDNPFDREFEPGTYEVRFHRGENGLGDMVALLERMQLPYSITEERSFKRVELERAEALHVAPSARVPVPERECLTGELACCPVCGSADDRDCELVVEGDLSSAPSLTVAPSGHLLVNEEMARILVNERISGCLLRNVRDQWGESKSLFQLLPTHTLPALQSPPTRITHEPQSECPVCEVGGMTLNSMLYYDAPLEDFRDLNLSAERFGSGPSLWQEIVVSQKLFRILVEHGAVGFQVEPVILI